MYYLFIEIATVLISYLILYNNMLYCDYVRHTNIIKQISDFLWLIKGNYCVFNGIICAVVTLQIAI